MLRICSVLVDMGIDKIRITGGEPFVRKDMMWFLSSLARLNNLEQLTLTTNGVLTAPYVAELRNIGIKSVNLSLDTLDAGRFFQITRRDEFSAVMNTLNQLLKHDIEVKINAVVMDGRNTGDIIPLVNLTKDLPVSVRFIEEMPFNGDSHVYSGIKWDYVHILEHIKQQYPQLQKAEDGAYSTAYNYHIAGHKGSIGVIAAYSRTFCGNCNRIRITPQGILRTCLYNDGVLNVKDAVRQGISNDELKQLIYKEINERARDGYEAETRNKLVNGSSHQSMAAIGG